MTTLSDLAAVVPEVAAYVDCTRDGCDGCCLDREDNIDCATTALTVTAAYYERLLLERERCGLCEKWRDGRVDECANRAGVPILHFIDRCHFIDAAHPHGKFEPIGGE